MTTDQKIERFFEAHPWAMLPAAAVTVAAGWAALYALYALFAFAITKGI